MRKQFSVIRDNAYFKESFVNKHSGMTQQF